MYEVQTCIVQRDPRFTSRLELHVKQDLHSTDTNYNSIGKLQEMEQTCGQPDMSQPFNYTPYANNAKKWKTKTHQKRRVRFGLSI
jgi:hypothetical protein